VTQDLRLERGWTAPELAEEFPHLGLLAATVEAAARRRSPRLVRDRLRALSDRYTGGRAVNLRQQPIPWAYRVFFRQIGIDPDERRTPPEEIALERMKEGGFPSRGLVDDALTIATVETGVAVVAFDADRVEGEVGLRLSRRGERLGAGGESTPGALPLSGGEIVVADAERSLALLFGALAEGRGVHPHTGRILLCGVRVKGVPEVSVEEALWTAGDVLTAVP
jgi:DNA/RNA-binding domain of Phe-tRNA-synthetase-like protein